MITRDQIKLIWVLARQLGMESNELHDVVSAVTGKDSIKALSAAALPHGPTSTAACPAKHSIRLPIHSKLASPAV